MALNVAVDEVTFVAETKNQVQNHYLELENILKPAACTVETGPGPNLISEVYLRPQWSFHISRQI